MQARCASLVGAFLVGASFLAACDEEPNAGGTIGGGSPVFGADGAASPVVGDAGSPPGAGGSNGGSGGAVGGPSGGPAGADAGGSGVLPGADGGSVGDAAARDAGKLGDPIPKECEGFPLEGLMESPGGSALPNKCHPFHVTLNNPYAVRCIDAWPWYKTPFPGDEYCILPPPAGKGIQVGFHPQEDNYWAHMMARDLSGYQNLGPGWTLPPSTPMKASEETRTYHNMVKNPSEQKYYRTYYRMRTGSHHNIITMHKGNNPAGWDALLPGQQAVPGILDLNAGDVTGILGGQERPDDSTPVTLDAPPEDEGHYSNFPINPEVRYNIHHFNTTDGLILKEGWVNLWWAPEGTKFVSWFMGLEPLQVPFLAVPPGELVDLHYAFTVSEPSVRLVRFFGHRHVWTPNFSAWIERAGGGNLEMIYQSFSWTDMPTYRYDSLVKNPAPNHAIRADGGSSGIITLKAGDKLHFNCHIEFTNERAVEEKAPMPATIGTLYFSNEALTAEMCIGYGQVVGGSLGLPAADYSPIPEAAKK
jgi:hypothetical protein